MLMRREIRTRIFDTLGLAQQKKEINRKQRRTSRNNVIKHIIQIEIIKGGMIKLLACLMFPFRLRDMKKWIVKAWQKIECTKGVMRII